MKRIGTALLLVILGFASGFALEKKNALSLFGGANVVFEYGSDDDYAPCQNDFPVTPAHAPLSFGLSFLHLFSGRFGMELDGRYASSTSVTLTDPSDGDTVETDTLQHVTLTWNLITFLGTAPFRFYVTLGAGGDFILDAKEQTHTTALGYEVTFLPPEKRTDFVADVGVGVLYSLGSWLSLRLDARYIFLPKTNSHPLIHNLNAAAGLFVKVF